MDLKQLLISFSVLWVSYSVFAQDNYNKGYIITLKQDTVQGLINLRTDKINAACCMFKSDMDASPVIYYPGDIQEYHFVNDGKLYVSRSVELSHGSTVQLFLECLFQGMKNLYYYESEDNKEFYFIVTAAVNNKKLLERTIECFRGFIDCLEGAEEKGVIYGTGAWQKGDIKNKKEMKEAYDMGKTI